MNDYRTAAINVKVTEKEKERMQRIAQQKGLTLSNLIRFAVFQQDKN